MSEAAILAAIEGTNSRLDDMNTNIAANRLQDQKTNTALWKAVNNGDQCRTKMKLDHQELKGEVKGMRRDIRRIMEDMRTVVGSLTKHIRSKAEHFNQEIKDEGIFTYAWRKKLQIAITSTIVMILTAAGGLLVTWIQTLIIGG